MKRVLSIAVVTLTVFSGLLFASPASDLQSNFINPPDSARPHTWWHWMNGNVTSEGITADLEAMAEVGVGGAQIFNVADKGSVDIPDGPAPFMSPQWLDLVKHAAVEADRLGIELCLHNCAGWSSTGGPWISPEYSMQMVVYTDIQTIGPAQFNQVLPQPNANMNFYRDIAILAFPTPKNDQFRIDDLQEKTGLRTKYALEPNLADTPADAAVTKDSIIDLTSKTDAKGLLQWQVPDGSWTILRIGHTTTGKTNHPAPVAGRGLECDKLSRAALDLHWENGIKPVLDKLGSLAPKTLNNILVDSYEVGANNWTPKMREEFKKRTGYDLITYLPAFSGRVVENAQTTERFLWDFRRVNSDLFAENYFGYFADKCRQHKLLASVEPYDGPFESLAVGAKYDILMGEFWVGPDTAGQDSSLKIAATSAHTHGQKIVGAEAFTAQPDVGRWQNHPASMKILGDQVYCVGVNRFIFHRYAMQPWTKHLPGMTMGQWGTHFDRTNTWWKQSKPWMTYLARSQYMLQQGQFAADVLLFAGQSTPNGLVASQRLKDLGYDYDVIGTDLIEKLSVKNGLLTLPAGMQYKLLVMPNTTFMTPALAEKITKLVKDGAVIVGPKPKNSPSFVDYPKSDTKLQAIADDLWGKDDNIKTIDKTFGKGRIITGLSPEDALKKLEIQPDFIDLSQDARTSFIHRKTKDADIYFVASRNTQQNTARCSFRITGKKPELWNSETGSIELAPLWQAEKDRTIVTIPFAPSGSMFVVFREPIDKNHDPYVNIESKVVAKPVEPSTDKLEIIKAQYGVLSNNRPGMVDVTAKLADMIKDNKLQVQASNYLADDPLPGQVKTLYVTYSLGENQYTAKAKEGKILNIPQPDVAADENKKLKIIAAVYGQLPGGQEQIQPPATLDITEKVAAKVKDAAINVRADNDLAGNDPIPNSYKQLKVTYAFNGITADIVVDENKMLKIPSNKFVLTPILPGLSVTTDGTTLAVPENGQYTLTKSTGQKTTIEVSDLPDPMEIKGDWKLKFTPGWDAPEEITLPELTSWTTSDVNGIRYYSGTAVYYKQFDVPEDILNKGYKIVLDLGQVLYFAQVKLNSKDLGILWKDPFHIDITDAVKSGSNKLEIAVTNLWPNRLIGDEQYPDDCQWSGKALKAWPDWFLKNEPRPVKERLTFTTWKHWNKDDLLMPSGLIGPVKINAIKIVPVTD